MKRLIVLLMLLALPVRTVLAVSGFGCAMLPAQTSPAQPDGAPCPMHIADGAQTAAHIDAPADTAPIDEASSSCPSCTAACCAALAPAPAAIVGTFSSADSALAAVETLFANAVRQAFERPPRAG